MLPPPRVGGAVLVVAVVEAMLLEFDMISQTCEVRIGLLKSTGCGITVGLFMRRVPRNV